MQLRSVGAITVLPFTTRGDRRPLAMRDMRVEDVFPLPSLLPRVPRATVLVTPEVIVGSGCSAYIAAGVPIRGYRSLAEACDLAAAAVAGAMGQTCTVLYTLRIDDVAHARGPAHMEVVSAVCALDEQVGWLAGLLGGRARGGDRGPRPPRGPAGRPSRAPQR